MDNNTKQSVIKIAGFRAGFNARKAEIEKKAFDMSSLNPMKSPAAAGALGLLGGGALGYGLSKINQPAPATPQPKQEESPYIAEQDYYNMLAQQYPQLMWGM